jgi:hypothetical protein
MSSILFNLPASAEENEAGAQGNKVVAEHCVRMLTRFKLVVPLPYGETAPLFGPEGERVWVGEHWDPHFIYPKPARDEEGAVFTVHRGKYNEIWVNTLFDVEARHFHYVYFMAELMLTTIDLKFVPVDQSNTQVDVTFTRTALTFEGNEQVRGLSGLDQKADVVWKKKIDNYLSNRHATATA